MKHFLLLIFVLFFSFSDLYAQDIPIVYFDSLAPSIEKIDDDKTKLRLITKRIERSQVFSIKINQKAFKKLPKDSLSKYTFEVKVNKAETTLLDSNYKLTGQVFNIDEDAKTREIFLEIMKDSQVDRDRIILLDIEVKKDTSTIDISDQYLVNKIPSQLEIKVESYEESLDGYEYLAYVGTNFDLVEGIRAKDLFFAGNILSKPNRFNKKSVGFYLSLYGNRAFTQVDSTGFVRPNTVYEQLTDTTYLKKTNADTFLSNRVTDNIGAYISPLIQLKWFRTKKTKNNLLLYYSPSLEFVYRRTTLSTKKLNSRTVEVETVDGDFNDVSFLNTEQPIFSEVYNEYSFNAGLIALFMCLENEKISVRVHGSVGYSSNYYREFNSNGSDSSSKQESDIFFSGRAWITEPKTGLTLQAEVTNNMINPRPFFVATLSKAFNFSQLASIFQPVVKTTN